MYPTIMFFGTINTLGNRTCMNAALGVSIVIASLTAVLNDIQLYVYFDVPMSNGATSAENVALFAALVLKVPATIPVLSVAVTLHPVGGVL